MLRLDPVPRRSWFWLVGFWLLLALPMMSGVPAHLADDVTATATAPTDADAGGVDAELDRLFAETWDGFLDLNPTLAHQIGDPRLPDRLTVDTDPERLAREVALFETAGRRLGALDLSRAGARHRLWAGAFRHTIDLQLAGAETVAVLLPLQPGFGLQAQVAQMASGTADLDFAERTDFEAYAGRLADFERWVDQVLLRLEEGRQKGVTHPRIVVERMVRELAGHLGRDAGALFRRPLERVDALPAQEREELEELVSQAVDDRLVPALVRLHAYLEATYLPAARRSLGLSEVPGGETLYRHLVRFYTSTDLEPEEIYELGEREVARLEQEIEALERRGGSRAGGSRGSMMERFEGLEKHVHQRLPELFLRIPEIPLEIRQVEPFRAGNAAGAFYERPIEGRRPGVFYVDLGALNPRTAEVLFLHEALPGHHFQISFAQEATDLPDFLRHGYVGAYVEGWGLYAESLGDELDLYHDPAQERGRLSYALGRSGRLIGDVGVHHHGWSHAEARRRLEARGLYWPAGEIVRYASLPAQALCYKVGELRLRAMRQRAEAALGEGFDLRRFHDVVLADGPLPLDVLDDKIDLWIAKNRRPSGE